MSNSTCCRLVAFWAIVAIATLPAAADCVGGDPLGQTLIADSKTSFSWQMAADVEVAVGHLSQVASYSVWARGPLGISLSLDTSNHIPASGTGVFYLVKPADAPCGSWQSSTGAEPLRDAGIPISCATAVPTDIQIEDAVATALIGLVDPWSDPDEFLMYSQRIQEELGCAFEAFFYAPHVLYSCGPAQGSTPIGLSMPTGLNISGKCDQQGRCYADNCITTEAECSFSPRSQASGCDDVLLDCCSTNCLLSESHLSTFVGDLVACETAIQLAASPSPAACDASSCPGAVCLEQDCRPTVSGSVFYGIDNGISLDSRAAREEFVANMLVHGVQEFESFSTGPLATPQVIGFPPLAATAELTEYVEPPGLFEIRDGATPFVSTVSSGQYLIAVNEILVPQLQYSTAAGDHLTIEFHSPQTAVGFIVHGGFGGTPQFIARLDTLAGPEYVNMLEPDQDSSEGALGALVFFGVINESNPVTSVTFRDPGFLGFIAYDDWYVGTPIPGAQANSCPCFNAERLLIEIEEWESAWALVPGSAGMPLPVTCPGSGESAISADFCGGDPFCEISLPTQFYRPVGSASATVDSCTFQRVYTSQLDGGEPFTIDSLTPIEVAACAANVAVMAASVGCP